MSQVSSSGFRRLDSLRGRHGNDSAVYFYIFRVNNYRRNMLVERVYWIRPWSILTDKLLLEFIILWSLNLNKLLHYFANVEQLAISIRSMNHKRVCLAMQWWLQFVLWHTIIENKIANENVIMKQIMHSHVIHLHGNHFSWTAYEIPRWS